MPWCHNCGTEYVEGILRCPDCGSDLSEEMPHAKPKKPKLKWSFKRSSDISAEWPKGESGENVPAAFLINVGGTQANYELTLSVLRAFGIPYACDFPGMGQVSRVYTGFSGGGMDIYVPETMLEDAKNILFSDSEEQK